MKLMSTDEDGTTGHGRPILRGRGNLEVKCIDTSLKVHRHKSYGKLRSML